MAGFFGGFGWGGAGWGGSTLSPGTVTVPGAATLFEAVRLYLKGVDGISDLTEVYENRPARGWSYPYLVMNAINGESEINNTNEYWETEEIQFSIVSDDDAEAASLGKLARRALLPHSNDRLVFDDGYEMSRMPTFHARLIEQPSREAGNTNKWMYSFGFRFLVGRSELV